MSVRAPKDPSCSDTARLNGRSWFCCLRSASALAIRALPPRARPRPPRAVASALSFLGAGPWQNDLDAFSRQVGGAPAIVGLYRDWTIPLINISQLDASISRGARSAGHVGTVGRDQEYKSDPNYALSTIVAGAHDGYLQASAQAAAAYGKQFQLRFAPEMNGSWAPWEGSVNGNTPALYVAAWQHVVSIFRAAGATNVRWVWSPNNGPTSTIPSYYPGDAWVDYIGIDGYNWGSSLGSWQSFSQVFGPASAVVTSLSAVKPIQISEMASAETGGNKAAWITSGIPERDP